MVTTSRLTLGQEEQPLVDTHASTNQPSDRVAVLLMGYGEVESYEDFANYNEQALNLLTAKFAPVPTWVYPPLAKLLAMFDLHEWSHQHGNFVSPHNQIFEAQRAGIESNLKKAWGDRVKVFKAFNFCAPHLPHQVLEQIKAEGYSKLLIYPLLVVDSIFTSGIAMEQVNQGIAQITSSAGADQQDHWVKGIRYIPSFFDRPDYIKLLAQQVIGNIEEKLAVAHLPSQTGVVLLIHGCPHEAKGFTSGIDESQGLYELVRKELMYRYPLITVGWMNHDTPMIKWTQPDMKTASKNLMDLGATALVYAPIGFATENHETLLDVDHVIESLRKKRPDVTYLRMECVNEHPDFVAMAAEWANPLVKELLEEADLMVQPARVDEVRDRIAHDMHQHHSHGEGHNHHGSGHHEHHDHDHDHHHEHEHEHAHNHHA